MVYLKLVRPLNLFIILLTLALFRYGLVDSDSYLLFQFQPKLDLVEFILLALNILLVAAGGYVINDIFDADIDRANRPEQVLIDREIDSLKAYNYYKILVIAGVLTTLTLAILTRNIRLATVPILIMVALNFYAQYFKNQLLVGNIVVALCSSLVVFLPGLYESEKVIDVVTANQNDLESGIFLAALFYTIFAFLTSLLREVIKDMEDMPGDDQFGCRTVPIVWGLKGAKLFCLGITLLIAGIWVTVALFFPSLKIEKAGWAVWGIYVFPLVIFILLLYRANTTSQFHRLSLFTKIYMLMGILSILYFLNGTGPYLFLQYLNYLKRIF